MWEYGLRNLLPINYVGSQDIEKIMLNNEYWKGKEAFVDFALSKLGKH